MLPVRLTKRATSTPIRELGRALRLFLLLFLGTPLDRPLILETRRNTYCFVSLPSNTVVHVMPLDDSSNLKV